MSRPLEEWGPVEAALTALGTGHMLIYGTYLRRQVAAAREDAIIVSYFVTALAALTREHTHEPEQLVA